MRQRKKDGEVKSNRPQDSKFKQQKLDAWQPILTPSWVIGTFILLGVIFTPIGAVLIVDANNLFEQTEVYDSPSIISALNDAGSDSPCIIDEINDGYRKIQETNGNAPLCVLNFKFTKDVPLGDGDPKLYLYYELTNFFQNHRRYVQSRSDSQLQNDVSISAGASPPQSLINECDPSESLYFSNTSLLFYPCGLIATSYFNEGIQLAYYRSGDSEVNWTNGIFTGSGSAPFTIDTTGIAWRTDIEDRFRNPTIDDNALQYETYVYLWQTYDQMSCYNNSNPTERVSCQTWSEVAREEVPGLSGQVPGDGCAACPPNSTAVYEGGIRPPDDYDSEISNFGVRTENFVVWMRTAALPKFRKLYGTISAESDFDGFKKGDELGIRIVPNFLVQSFDGSKALVLGTTTLLDGRNDILGIAYLVVGVMCLVLASLFWLKLKISPRKLGDPKYLSWKQN